MAAAAAEIAVMRGRIAALTRDELVARGWPRQPVSLGRNWLLLRTQAQKGDLVDYPAGEARFVFQGPAPLAALHAALTPPGELPRVVRLYQKLKAVARLWPGLTPVPGIVHGTHAYAHLRARNYDPWIMPGSK